MRGEVKRDGMNLLEWVKPLATKKSCCLGIWRRGGWSGIYSYATNVCTGGSTRVHWVSNKDLGKKVSPRFLFLHNSAMQCLVGASLVVEVSLLRLFT